MDVLKSLASPPSLEHYHLLLLIGALVSLVLFPYLGFLLGTSFLSNRFEKRGRKEGNALYLRFARNVSETALVNKTIPTVLSLLPALSIVFVYAQALQTTASIAVSLAGFGFLTLSAAVILLYAYKYTFQIGDLLEGYKAALQGSKKGTERAPDVKAYSESNEQSHARFGRYGLVLTLISTFLLTSSIVVAGNPAHWLSTGSVLGLFIAPDVYVRFLQFLALAGGGTGIGVLFFTFSWKRNGEPDAEYAAFVRTTCQRMTTGSLLALPVLMLLGYALLPGESLSGTLFGLAGLVLVLLLLSAQFVYAHDREHEARHAASAFFVFGCAAALLSVNDQVVLYNVTKGQSAYLSYRHDMAIEELKGKLGVAGVVLSGQEIFDAKCSACHMIDQKKVGPAYKDVVPKYAGKKDQMIAFVLNPVKVDPDFPPMPNQGLKRAEADSIVSYLLRQLARGK